MVTNDHLCGSSFVIMVSARWLSARIMMDYDVNEEEWKEDGSPVQAGLRPMR